jgi:uncharacterized protein (DUF427 family)
VGLSWQQGPLSTGAIGRFLVPEPLPKRLLYVELLRRRMRVRFGGTWIADSEQVLLLFEPGRYPVAYFPETDISSHVLERTDDTVQHPDLGPTSWYAVRAGEHIASRGAWQHTGLPAHASELQGRIAFAWQAMDAFYEEDERIAGHAADSYHRIDIRQTSRHLVVRHRDRTIADTMRPLVLYESGFAPRWYVQGIQHTVPECGTRNIQHTVRYTELASDVQRFLAVEASCDGLEHGSSGNSNLIRPRKQTFEASQTVGTTQRAS